jgi:hypothetical protein
MLMVNIVDILICDAVQKVWLIPLSLCTEREHYKPKTNGAARDNKGHEIGSNTTTGPKSMQQPKGNH